MSLSTAIKTTGTAGDLWGTPQDLFNEIQEKFLEDKIVFDPCPNHKRLLDGARFFPAALGFDGLNISWIGDLFINPPFSDIEPWVKKSCEYSHGKIAVLLPARTDQKWYHLYAPFAKTVFIRGRVNYVDINSTKKSSASFASMLLIFGAGKGIDFWYPECHKNRRKEKLSIPSVSDQNKMTRELNEKLRGGKA